MRNIRSWKAIGRGETGEERKEGKRKRQSRKEAGIRGIRDEHEKENAGGD